MANLRLVNIKAEDSTTILAKFTADLDPLINTSNVVVTSITPGVPDPSTLKVIVSGNVLRTYVQPLTPLASYNVTFQSTSVIFRSKDGQSVLFEDGKTNAPLVIGPEEPADQVRDFLVNFLKDSVYNLDTGTLVRDIINSQSKYLSKAIHDVGQAKNDNYLQFNVVDEVKTRGSGPFDRLNQEGAFEVVRVGKRPGASTSSGSISYDSFPRGPITLQAVTVSSETLVAGTGPSTFNELVFTVVNGPVTKLNSVTVIYADHSKVTYDIEQFGYQIKDPRYDQDFASTLLTLENTQFKLSDVVLDTSFVIPVAGDSVVVSYDYKHTGRIIESDSVAVSQVLDIIREPIPPILTEFTLDNFPIVDANDEVENFNGVAWLDPLSNPPFSGTHPAFVKEIPFKFEGMPSNPGEFSIDYNTGRVFVYGAVTSNGTGDYPPVATYKYRNTFDDRIDYTYNPDTYELVASPLRELSTQQAKISYDFEQTLVPDVDFVAKVHQESLDERVENRINSTIAVSVLNTPITNVFRVFNETSGEVYSPTRFTDSVIYFNSTTPPRILELERERASFQNVSNEILLIDSERTNTLGTRVLKVVLENNRIISASEDVIGSSYNSSASFSITSIFAQELFFDGQILSATANTDRLTVGQYQIDYRNGIIYVGVTAGQGQDLGTISYRSSIIVPRYPHLISVSELYHSISEISGVNKRINYTSFGDSEIQPSTFDVADERFLNGDTTLPYLVTGNTITVSDDIKDVRSVYDAYDLNNNTSPTNFADGSTVSANIISLDATGVRKQELSLVSAGLVVTVPFISAGAGISSVFSVVRVSDGIELWDSSGSFLNYNITLSGAGSPTVGDIVMVTYRVRLNGAATPVVDYNRGDYFVDYTYLADEILVSYEYGDNVLDFRKSSALDEGDQYYVTYKVGALRDSLLQNFGTLVDIPILNTFDVTLARENYRDALKAALQSFTKGPTIPSMKLLVSNITKIDPEIIEGVFRHWSLGISNLYPNAIGYTDNIQLLSAKYDNGVLLQNPGETVTFPVSSNLRLENGSLEMWVIPEWDGIDNDATLTFQVFLFGDILDASNIYIGASSFNPTYDDNNKFSINRRDELSPVGLPSKIYTHTGLFIYYDPDEKKWNVLARDVIDALTFGDGSEFGDESLFGIGNRIYSGTIETTGEMYDVRFKPGLGEINDVLRSRTKTIEFEFNLDINDGYSPDGIVDGYSITDGYFPGDGYVPGYSFDGITFMSDDRHYLFDWGKEQSKNRFSLFKDGRGYLNFRVWDRGDQRSGESNKYDVTTDVSAWVAGQKHHVGISWCLNTANRMDEMHLFVDGFEVPNIMRYGGRPAATQTDRFRTVKPEIVAGIVPKNTRTGNDLTTTLGSPTVVSASLDFEAAGIVIGDTIDILENGFGTFTILFVAANTLLLDSPMPVSFTDARFSVNAFSVIVSTQVDLFANIAVSIMDGYGVETEIPGLRADIPAYSISKNMLNQNILTLLGNADAGDQIILRTLGLNHRRCRDRAYVWGNISHILKTQLPPPVNLDEVSIRPVLLPLTNINPTNAVLLAGRFILSGLSATQPSSPTEGRTLSVRMSGGNVNYSNPPTVTIFGTTVSGALFEVFTFTSATTKNSTEKFKTITSVTIESTPVVTTLPSVSVEIKEAYSMTSSEGNAIFPVIRYSYKSLTGSYLAGTGTSIVTDIHGYFIDSHVGNSLVIYTPASVAGTYTITSRIDANRVTVSPIPPAAFSNGTYDVFITSIGRNGFQNGFFTLETAGMVDTPFLVQQGLYEFDYAAYLEIPFDPISSLAYVGSDFSGLQQAKAVIDELRILSTKITDVRVGESIGVNEKSFTTSFTSLNPFIADRDTLMLLHFDSLPLVNSADFWITSEKMYLQSSNSVNSSFEKSILITDAPLVKDNKGLLSTTSEGSIEFWVSPRFDTFNDPNYRFYFDASSAVVENVTSITNGTVQVSGSTSNVLSVRLQTDTENIGTDFFVGGSIASDSRTINLGRALPSQRTPVKVTYVPAALSGDRISIFKNREGAIVFNVRARGIDYQINHMVFWARDTWHRIQATYKFNRADNLDEIRLFVDGEEGGMLLFGNGILFGQGIIFGQGLVGNRSVVTFGSGIIFGTGVLFGQGIAGSNKVVSDINFTDPINQFQIGADFQGANIAQARFDNLRLSNISRNPLVVAGQPKDINFSTNREIVLPVVEDAFTTYLLDFNTLVYKTDDLALLRNEEFGIHNFDLNVIDSFDIVLSQAKIQQILETLVYALKPAQSKVNISYVQ